MEVKIGVTHANRELSLESSQSADDVLKAVNDALASDDGLLVLSDDKGRTVYVPAGRLAYVEVVGAASRRMGFAPG
ncbi:MAG: DUF3107 domain-containing protein [Propionibacteriales bacterium]|nr:DUF3107 domain-containing protein [Propionibacteriales bacterium]